MLITKLNDLNGVKHENFNFLIENEKIIIKNRKEKFEISFELNEKRRMKIADSILKLTGLRIKFSELDEREIISFIESKGFNKTIWNAAGKGMHKYNMIEEGDRIAVGVSGGKDSLLLLNLLVRVKKISNVNFDIIPIHIHPEEDNSKYEKIKNYCSTLGLELQVHHTTLADMLFNDEKIKNPCFLCGRIRRGILYRLMKEQNINKLALGHHKDDIIETFLLNIFFQGNTSVMKPKYFSKNHSVTVIRPLAFVEESNIIKYSRKVNLPILVSECPYETSESSKRLRVKNLIKELSAENSDVRSVILNSIMPLLED